MKKTLTNVVRYALVSLFSFLFIGSAQADELKMALFNYCNTGYEVDGWRSCQQDGGGALNTETDNGVSVGGATIGGNFKRSFSKLVGTDLPTFATADMQANLGIEVPYNVYISGVANGAKTDGTITISGLNAESSYVIYAGCGHDNGNIGKSSCGFKVPSNGCAEVDSLDYVVTVASNWGRSGSSTVVADSFTSFDFGESICAGADGLALIRMKGIVPKSGGTIDLVLTGERAGINFLAIKELPPPVLPETTIDAEAVKVSDINSAAEFAGCTSTDKVIVNLTAAKTLEFNADFAFGQAKIVYDGALKLLGEAAPSDLAKFDFKGVTSLDYAWLPVGSGMAINFNEGQGKLGDTDEALIPGLTIYGNTWNNVGTSGSLDAKLFGSDGSTVLADTIPVSYNGGSYQWTNATTPYLKGYLDDSNISFKTTVPFSYYDVYIICATDTANAKFSYKTINGVNYSANDNGEAVAGSTAAWGASQQSTPILGKNVMRLSGLTTQKFEITNSPKVSGSVRGCIAAIVIVKAEPPSPAVTATIDSNTTWSALWTTAPTANTPVELTFVGSATLTIDTEVVAKNIKLIGDTTAQVVGIAGTAANINAFLGKVTETTDFAGKFDYRFDVTSGLAADSALLNMIKNAGGDKIFTFIGSGENGVTFGSSSSTWNGTLSSHIVLNGGKHAIYWSNGNALFGTGASVDNPTLLLDGNATMDFYGHDITGWNAYANDDNTRLAGVIRINNGSTLNMHRQGGGTVYYNQTFCIEGGAKITTDIDGTDARMGGAKIVVPAQDAVGDPAEIVCLSTGSGSLFFGKDIPKGAEFSVGANAKLKITGAVESLNSGNTQVAGGGDYPLNKTGAGILEVTGNILAPVNVNGGSIALGGTAKSITFADDATLTSLNAISLKDFSVAEGKTLTLDATAGDIAITKAPTNNGTIKIVGGNVAFMPDTNVGTIIEEGGKAVYGYIVNINNLGKFTIPEGKTAETIRLFDAAGTAIPFTDNLDGTVSYEWVVTGGVCWWDYEFEGNGNNDGADGTALSWDDPRPRQDAEFTEDGELYVSSSPWRGGVNWPTKATFVMYGTMVGSDKTYQIGFGSTYQGPQPYNTIFLATDTVSENTVNLCICQAKNAPTVLCQMTVPNAQTAKHLYAFTLKTVENKTVVDIYLDGELLQSYPFDSQIVLGTGFQVGSGHGGVCTGYNKTVAEDEAVLDFLRVYTEELSAEAHTKYAVKYPYVSPNGSYQRTVTADADWSVTDAWTKEGTDPAEFADEPIENATVKLAVDGETTLGVNLDGDITYEAIQINGADLTLALAEGEQTGKVKSSGRVTANANVTFAYDAFSMAGAPLTVKQGKTVTFDLSMVDMTQYFSTQTYDLTGYLTLETGANITFIAPAELHGREATAAIDPVTQHYVVTVTPPDYQFVYKNGEWTWGTQKVTEEIINANPSIARSIESNLEMSLGSYTYSVEDGATLKPLDQDAPCTITVNAGGTFDLNGTKTEVAANTYAVTLNGGTLANSAEGLGIVKSLTLTDDAAIALTAGSIAIQSAHGGWAATTLALGENTLTITKSGESEARLELVETTVDGTGTIDVQSGTIWMQENNRFGESTVKLGDAGVFAIRSGRTATISAIEAVEGATLDNAGTITDFTLTGAIELAGAGTFGTITLDEAALDLATVHGLTLAGEGSVKATITAAEMAEGIVGVFTKTDDATIDSVTLFGEDGEELSGYTADYDEEGNYIAYFTVTFNVPAIEGATASIEGYEIGDDGSVTVPYGSDLKVVYTANENKLFSDGATTKEFEITNVTAAPEIDVSGISTTDAEAKIGDTLYLTITNALAVAQSGATVTVIKDAQLASLTVPTGVTLDLNNKMVVAQSITNNGTIVIYDAATAVAFVDNDIAGVIKFGADIMITCGDIGGFPSEFADMMVYVFPQGGTFEIIPPTDMGQTALKLTLPTGGFAVDMIGLEAKKNMSVVWAGNSPDNTFVLAGEICRGSRVDTRVLVAENGKTIIAGSIVVGCDSVNPNIDYTTYPNGKATLEIQGEFATDALLGEPSVTLIPERGELVTFAPIEAYSLPVKTVEGAEVMVESQYINELYTRYVYTAEWIYPEAKVEATTVDGFDAAYIYTAANDAPHYDTETASFVLTANKAIPADAVKIGGKFSTMDWNIYNLPALEANTEYKVTEATWSQVKAISPFTCGAASIALTEDTEITLTLKLGDEVIDTKVVSLKAIPVLPTAQVTSTTAEGYETAVEFTADEIGVGYDDWNAKFVLIPDVAIGANEIMLGGSYAQFQEGAWIDLPFPACEANEEIDVLGLGNISVTVSDVFNYVNEFKCGVKNLALKNDATFTLKLVITDGETTKEICSIDNLKVEAKTIEPVDPEEPQTYDDDTKAAEAAAEMNGENGTIKPEFINAPEGFDGNKAAYAALFAAVAEGNTVTVKLTVDAEKEIKEDLAKPENAATILTPDENGEATIAAKPGLFYGIVAEGSLDAMATAKGQNWVMATGNTVKVEVPTVTDTAGNKAKAAFFRPTCAVKMPVAE